MVTGHSDWILRRFPKTPAAVGELPLNVLPPLKNINKVQHVSVHIMCTWEQNKMHSFNLNLTISPEKLVWYVCGILPKTVYEEFYSELSLMKVLRSSYFFVFYHHIVLTVWRFTLGVASLGRLVPFIRRTHWARAWVHPGTTSDHSLQLNPGEPPPAWVPRVGSPDASHPLWGSMCLFCWREVPGYTSLAVSVLLMFGP